MICRKRGAKIKRLGKSTVGSGGSNCCFSGLCLGVSEPPHLKEGQMQPCHVSRIALLRDQNLELMPQSKPHSSVSLTVRNIQKWECRAITECGSSFVA